MAESIKDFTITLDFQMDKFEKRIKKNAIFGVTPSILSSV